MHFTYLVGLIAMVLNVIALAPYMRDTMRGTTRPHAYSWLIWFALNGIPFVAQLTEGAGLGAWVAGVNSVLSGAVFLLAIRQGDPMITRGDTYCLVAALV